MKIALIGRTEILYDTAEFLLNSGHEIAIIITAKAAPEYTRSSKDFQVLANRLEVPFIHTAQILEIHKQIQSLGTIDIGVSMNYPGVIPAEIINLFPLGILNAHGGDLPRYRGNACQAWAIINGEPRVGLCVHKMIGGELDSGDIIARDYFQLSLETTITEVYGWMSSRVPELFMQALHLLSNNPGYVLERQSKNPQDALRCYPRKPKDGCIDWEKSALEILRLINASTKPYAGAFTFYRGKVVRVWKARIGAFPCASCFIPGQVLWINKSDGSVAVGTGDSGVIEIEIVQADSSEPIQASDLVKSLRDRFGRHDYA